MCGGIAVISSSNADVFETLYDGLCNLQNRGYDSAGICGVVDNNLIMYKRASDENKSAIEYLKTVEEGFKDCSIGIGHTRWATHGEKNDVNAHPHICFRDSIALVHNGIIENYVELREFLSKHGISCKSTTDSEVVVNLISLFEQQLGTHSNLSLAMEMACEVMVGTWSIIVLSKNDPNTLYFTRNRSPLVVACGDHTVIVASEVAGISGRAHNYSFVEEQIVYRVSLKDKDMIDSLPKKVLHATKHPNTPYPYDHWTLKEIYEQADTVASVTSYGKRLTKDTVVLDGLEHKREHLLECQDVILLGCGTSLNAARVVESYFEEQDGFVRVKCMDGADFEVSSVKKRKTLVILVSQSGETKDLHRCIELIDSIKWTTVVTLGVVNVVDSIISQETDCGVFVNAEREVGVASTKSFTAQVVVLSMISMWFIQNREQSQTMRNKLSMYIKNLNTFVEETPMMIEYLKSLNIRDMVSFVDNKSAFVLGKGKGIPIASECALKIKEITYVHAEGYSYSSLKHGPLALIEKDTPVIFIADHKDCLDNLANSVNEVKSRLGKTIVIGVSKLADIPIPVDNEFTYLWCNMAVQLIAYHLAVRKGINCDKPRNLAKVVTVL